MSDYKLKDSTKTTMRHILQDSATKRTNLSLRINEDLHAEYKSLADAYKKISGTSLPLGALADKLIEDLNQICRNEVAMMIFNSFPRGSLINIIQEMAKESTFDSDYSLIRELKLNKKYQRMNDGVCKRLDISYITCSSELDSVVQREAFITYSKLK
ncbi:hypothetical protein [Photobacterium phosphoreum]|uniref:hypothetical protein n=1 Tax=Photobacterium phosphoreum TaxID=659 RepID=UPI0039B02864